MDDGCSSWLPFLGGGIDDGVSSTSGSEAQQKQDLPLSSQVEEQLQQLYMLIDMDKNGHAEPVPSSESSMFRSFSGSPDETSSVLKRRRSNNTTANNSCHHPAQAVSSQQIQLSPSPVPYYGGGDRHYDHQCYSHLDTILNLKEFKCQEAHNHHNERAQHRNGGRRGAFMPYAYARHLGPKKKPNKQPSSGGQKAIKAAMSALARMHMVRLAQWRCYQMELAVAPAPPTGSSNCNQLQHVLSERRRREKLDDSFKALRTVLPPASKKDKASLLIRARDYVSTLESRVSELEEKNRRMLVELQHCRSNGGDVSSSRIEVDIDVKREASTVNETSQEFHLKIVVGSECNAMDAVVSILECLKEIGDVRLVAMDTGSRATTLTLQMKSSRWDQNILKEYVTESVKGAMKSKIETS